MRLVRERLLARLVQRHAISEELVRKLLAWKHPGFTDPLKCPQCGARLVVVGYVTDQMNVRKVLDHLGLSPPEEPRPPPELHYVPVDDEGGETPVPAVQ
jgi:hypothetical protein